ncbi:hypothetical protein BD410DRAFT_132480 [Rickenella mellea]|uniref:Restriction of telomere capping protein 4 n=1 Tax=Rickenella mellea TaxID=50990 RepID=A0A4Y7Q9N6_9AGAM|nr:hypothetical protein BD410DRAFT_132480 [Rickenella mellea]
MDGIMGNLRERGVTLGNSQAMRIPSKHTQSLDGVDGRGKGKGWEPLGNTTFEDSKVTKSKVASFDDESDDELDVMKQSPISIGVSKPARPQPRPAYRSSKLAPSSPISQEDATPKPKKSKKPAKAQKVAPRSVRGSDSDVTKVSQSSRTNQARNSRKGKQKFKPSDDDNEEDEEELRRVSKSRQKQEFPMPSPLGSPQRADSPDSSPPAPPAHRARKRKGTSKEPKRSAFPTLAPLSPSNNIINIPGKSTFPDLTPLAPSPESSRPRKSRCPLDAPLFQNPHSSQSSVVMPPDSERSDGENIDDDDTQRTPKKKKKDPARRAVRPFPMETQELESLRKQPFSPSSTSSKRSSPGDNQAGPSKRTRTSEILMDLPLDMADMSFMQDVAPADPSSLCPYCDEVFPSDPSPLLENMRSRVRAVSRRDPRPGNRLGLKAPIAAFVAFCQRHRFESHQLPKAKARGWPTRINFAALPRRIEEMRDELESLIMDKDSSEFWKELQKVIGQSGTRMALGVRGQFGSFEKGQPGYYGEQGSIIIGQVLYNLFPPSTMNADLVSPLTPTEFIQHILVPEVGVALIRQDLDINTLEAIKVLRKSSQYGVAMFPHLDNKEDDVGEELVRERARIRRQEIEEEERAELEAAKTKAVPKPKAKIVRRPTVEPDPRPQKSRRKETEPAEEEEDLISLTDDTAASDASSKRSTRSKGKGKTPATSRTLVRGQKDAESIILSDGSTADSGSEVGTKTKSGRDKKKLRIVDNTNSSQALSPITPKPSKTNDIVLELSTTDDDDQEDDGKTPRPPKAKAMAQKHSSQASTEHSRSSPQRPQRAGSRILSPSARPLALARAKADAKKLTGKVIRACSSAFMRLTHVLSI